MSSEPTTAGLGRPYIDPNKAILTDITKCIGCERCVEGCNRVNKLPREIPTRYRSDDGLSGRRLSHPLSASG